MITQAEAKKEPTEMHTAATFRRLVRTLLSQAAVFVGAAPDGGFRSQWSSGRRGEAVVLGSGDLVEANRYFLGK